MPAYVLGRLHLLLDPDRTKAKERARNLAFLAALLTLVNGSPELRVSWVPMHAPCCSGYGTLYTSPLRCIFSAPMYR